MSKSSGRGTGSFHPSLGPWGGGRQQNNTDDDDSYTTDLQQSIKVVLGIDIRTARLVHLLHAILNHGGWVSFSRPFDATDHTLACVQFQIGPDRTEVQGCKSTPRGREEAAVALALAAVWPRVMVAMADAREVIGEREAATAVLR